MTTTTATNKNIRPYMINISQEDVDDLKSRLRGARFPPASVVEQQQGSENWDDGTSLAYMRDLTHYWLNDFDWRQKETKLNETFPQFMTTIDGLDIHFVHVRAARDESDKDVVVIPLIFTHGWPGTFLEVERLLPLLKTPKASEDGKNIVFDIVAPSLPGYAFSSPPKRPGCSIRYVAELWDKLMTDVLGYDKYVAQGGDIGCGVTMWLAALFPQHVIGAHLNLILFLNPAPPDASLPSSPPLEDKEMKAMQADSKQAAENDAAIAAYQADVARWYTVEGGYYHEQATKPQTLSYAMTDSPTGLAAWVLEKCHLQIDPESSGGRSNPGAPGFETALTRDLLLTTISIYWFTNALSSSYRMYKENVAESLLFDRKGRILMKNTTQSKTTGDQQAKEHEEYLVVLPHRITTPLGVANFPREILFSPRRYVELAFSNVTRWSEMSRGGHFAALEEPQMLADEIRAFVAPLLK